MQLSAKLVDFGNDLRTSRFEEGSSLSFEEMQSCCSLSNRGVFSLLFNRVCLLIKTRRWINDAAIGMRLVYDYLWISSTVAKNISQNEFSQREAVLAKLDLVIKVFEDIVLSNYRHVSHPAHPHLSASIPELNSANVGIRNMFPVRISCDVGVTSAVHIYNKIKGINDIYKHDNPRQAMIDGLLLSPVLRYAHFNRPEGTCWTQWVRTSLLPTNFMHVAKCVTLFDEKGEETSHTVDSEIDKWWTTKTEQQKIQAITEQKVSIQTIDEVYSRCGRDVFVPYKIHLEIA